MYNEGDATKSGYLTFDRGGMSKINWRPTGGQVSESRRDPRGKKFSDPSKNPSGSSTLPILDKYCKMFTYTPRTGRVPVYKGNQ